MNRSNRYSDTLNRSATPFTSRACESVGRAACRKTSPATDRRYFRRVVEQLKLHLPPSRPVIVLAGKQLSKKDGDCGVVCGKFQIRVSRDLNESQAIDVLLHEWAHALSWEACVGKVAKSRSISDYHFDRLAHGPKWGLAYSEVYLCYTGVIVLNLQAEDLNREVFQRSVSSR